MAYELEKLIAQRLIARQDVKAQQMSSKSYQPVWEPWKRSDITAHLAGVRTYGHYMVSRESQCKLFCLDIDIIAGSGFLPTVPWDTTGTDEAALEHWRNTFQNGELRKAWLDRSNPSRSFTKFQLRMISAKAMQLIWEELGIPCAVASSGSKGLHVYGFTGLMPAIDAREAAILVMELMGWKLSHGNSLYTCLNDDPLEGFPNFNIEIFPKQETLGEGQLGNLVRLPLGVNKKAPKNPTWFLDPRAPMAQWVKMDPLVALDGRNPWSD
jgi:hypothetical protein